MTRINTLLLTASILLLAACQRDAATVASQEAAHPEPTETGQPEPAEAGLDLYAYRAWTIDELADAERLTAACEREVSTMEGAIDALEAFAETPGVENYLEALNAQVVSVSNMAMAANTLGAVHPDKTVRDAADVCSQSLTPIFSDITLSRPIYERVSGIDLSGVDAEAKRAVEQLMLTFRLSGVDKDEATRARIKALNEEIFNIGQEFDRNIRESVKVMELDSVDQLAGLPQDYIDAHQPDENGKIAITTQYPDLFPFMDYAEDDSLRRELTILYSNRAYPENEAVLMKLLEKRFELAQLLGFDNYAQLVTADKMVGSPERVEAFLGELTAYTEESQQAEYDILLTRLRQIDPDAEKVESWQRRYLMEKVTSEQFEVDSKLVRQYFNYNATRDGILTLVQDLFGVEFRPWDTSVWHESVTAHEMWDGDQLIGRFYLDMHPREGKYQHAAAFPMRNGISGVQAPVATLVCNFPAGDDLMQHDQVVTFLHEFGHLIHNLFAGHHRWDNISGINTEWDFVEAPSQMLEEWVWDYDTISKFAKNTEDEPIPRELLDRMIAARDFGLGLGTRRQLSFAALSMGLYNRSPEGIDIKALSDEIINRYTMFEPLPEEHFFASFGHLNGYSAIYYTYQWSLAIATDMLTRFEKEGLRNVETAGDYRDKVLAQGGARPAAELVTDFLGREISFKPYADRLSGADKPRIETQPSGG